MKALIRACMCVAMVAGLSAGLGCSENNASCCGTKANCCKDGAKACAPGCTKPCCAKDGAAAKKCGPDCKKACCKKA